MMVRANSTRTTFEGCKSGKLALIVRHLTTRRPACHLWTFFPPEEQNAVFDLTVLLTTGKASPALSDFNQTGELTSERVSCRANTSPFIGSCGC